MNEKHRFKIQTKYIQQVVFGKILSQVSLNNCLLLPLVSLKETELRLKDTQMLSALKR